MSCHRIFEIRIKRMMYSVRTGDMNSFKCLARWMRERKYLMYRDVIYTYRLKNSEYIADVSCSVPRYGVFQRVRTFHPIGGVL